MSRLRSIGFALAALGFTLSTMVHVASLFAVVPLQAIAPLFFGVMTLAVPLVLTAEAQRRGRFFGPSWRELMKNAPPWGERVFQLVFLYVLLHFGALLLATRTTIAADRPAPPGAEARMFSAFLLLMYLLCALTWWKPHPDTRPTA